MRALIGYSVFGHLLMLLLPILSFFIFNRKPSEYGLKTTDFSKVLKLSLILSALFLFPLTIGILFGFTKFQELFFNMILLNIAMEVLIAFAEEFFYRGYLQSVLNSIFKKRFTFFGIPFTWSCVIISVLFGLGHAFPITELLMGNFFFKPWGLILILTGFCYGLLREKTGNIIAPVIIHLVMNFGEVFITDSSTKTIILIISNILLWIGLIIFTEIIYQERK